MLSHWFRLAGPVVLLGCLTGCMPKQFVSGVAWEIRHRGAHDAKSQWVRDRPYLRANTFLLDRFNQVSRMRDVLQARSELSDIVERCHRLARHSVNNEIDRLPRASLDRLWERFFPAEPKPAYMKEELRRRFWSTAQSQYVTFQRSIKELATLDEVHKLARSLRRATGRSPKDRHGGGLLLALVAASIHIEHGPLDRGGPWIDVYDPNRAMLSAWKGESGRQAGEDRLLARYAPIIVQERVDNPPYEQDTDLIGTVRLEGTVEQSRPTVDIAAPSMYGYWQYCLVDDRPHLQLTYTYWFPRYPKLKFADPEAGLTEGATLRITLDRFDRPAIFETLLNCGCYHRCYPAKRIEEAACKQYGAPQKHKRLCVARPRAGKIDWAVPETVDVSLDRTARPIVFSRAGYHGPAGVTFDRGEMEKRTVLADRAYTLRRYDELERLPVKDGYASLFDEKGLVRGAERLEGFWLMPTGMLSAGQPRQRGTQLLHWDQYDFDDPHLLEENLRLPSGF